MGGIDTDFIALHDMAEEVLNKYNAVTRGITTVWQGFVARHQTEQTVEAKDIVIKELEEQLLNKNALLSELSQIPESSTLTENKTKPKKSVKKKK